MCKGNDMAIQNDHHHHDNAASEAILENVWASFIGEDGIQRGRSDAGDLSKSWEELPRLDKRDGSMEILQRLPSLGRWMSMGAEAWEELLGGIVIPTTNIVEQSLDDDHNSKSNNNNSSTGPKLNAARAEKTVANKAMAGAIDYCSGTDRSLMDDMSSLSNGNNNKYPHKKRASREWEQDVQVLEQPAMKIRSVAGTEDYSFGNELYDDHVLEFQDLGSEYLDSLLSSW
ncbi:hypothetical protein JRO89_XS06G0059800 [Xanthoceras sorbifolium]|uniref:Uncharacterized protein n=1 Tax=Xanthoceras sorbifolium TaxID=99658 RepID=A0ABQ8HWW2_9ROSI|nr:hypothetical protein JRO89_XS06G0059800 [Xanthoceras sorbifolium]